jgi:hypothetical protein
MPLRPASFLTPDIVLSLSGLAALALVPAIPSSLASPRTNAISQPAGAISRNRFTVARKLLASRQIYACTIGARPYRLA